MKNIENNHNKNKNRKDKTDVLPQHDKTNNNKGSVDKNVESKDDVLNRSNNNGLEIKKIDKGVQIDGLVENVNVSVNIYGKNRQRRTTNIQKSAPQDVDDNELFELKHLHPDIEAYEKHLPKLEHNFETQKNYRKQLPTNRTTKPPIIKYNAKGFRPYAQMVDFFKSHEPIKIVGGTYDAGKTYSCVAYMDMLARTYEGARLTFIHQILKRVYKNIIPTYEKYLGFKPTGRTDPSPTPIIKYGGEQPEFFEYWNGSRIYINGLDNPDNLLSDFYDAAFVNQVELIDFRTWDQLTARVSERTGNMPIAFLIGDCNPSAPNHWIRRQTKARKITYFEMSFKDNPEIYDQQTGQITVSGERRVNRLQKLEGLRYKRGYEGKWVSGEGLVFDTFLPEVHVIDKFDIPLNWGRYLSIDWGHRNPCCCIWWARDTDDRIYAYKEIYKTGLTKPEFIRMIRENCGLNDRIIHVAVDSADQDGVAQLKDVGYIVEEPKKSRIAQIDAIKERLRIDVTGKPAIFFMRDRLVHPPDENLQDAHRPIETTDEFLSCTYDEKVSRTNRDDEAVIGDNHGIDSTAYFILSLQDRSTIGSGKVHSAIVKL